MKHFIFLVTLMICSIQMNAQVLTRHLAPDQNSEEYIYFPVEYDINYLLQPEVDFDQVREEDIANGNPLYRFAVKVDQHYTQEDGTWYHYGNLRVWEIGFSAPNASSLNFLISDLTLPEGSEMFILSKDGRIIHGPVTPDLIYDQVYASDIIESTEVLIAVKTKQAYQQEFSINIHGVCQGIPKPLEMRGWQDAIACNYDVNCPIGSGWENERDAVACMLKNGTEWCSGALVNDQCQDLKSYFLSAFHCLDSDHDGSLDSSEKNLSIYAFRFKYEASEPQCPGKSTGTQGTWITYSGATFRSAYAPSDFALAELNGSISNHPNITLAGWDRTLNIATSGVGIHHPSGDAKKISVFNSAAVRNDNYTLIDGSDVVGDFHWVVTWNKGVTEGGSSGSPLFNQNHQIVGQLAGGNSYCGSLLQNDGYGRFDNSWSGGGTNNTQLSYWLAGANPPSTVNTIRSPSIHGTGFSIPNNEFLICTTNKQFNLSNPLPGSTVTWSVSNSGLFATTGGASTSGVGTSATLRAASASSSGSAILTFTMSQDGCPAVTVTRELWVGSPDFGLNFNDYICLRAQDIASIDLYGNYGMSLGTIQWSFSGSITGVGSNNIARYRGVSVGWGSICLTATNGCGTTTKCYWVYVDNCEYLQGELVESGNYRYKATQPINFILSPNPATNLLHINITNFDKDAETTLFIRNVNGLVVHSFNIRQNKIEVDMTGDMPGVYFVQIMNKYQITSQKLIKL